MRESFSIEETGNAHGRTQILIGSPGSSKACIMVLDAVRFSRAAVLEAVRVGSSSNESVDAIPRTINWMVLD